MRRSQLSHSPTARSALQGTVAVLAGLFLIALTAGPASAHDTLTGSEPTRGAQTTAQALHGQVVLHFEEPPITLGDEVRVTGPSGEVAQGAPRVSGSDVIQALEASLPAGPYTITWRVVADDGHVVTGTIPFTITRGSAADPTTASPAATAAGPAPRSSAASSPTGFPVILGVIIVLILALVAAAAVIRRNRAKR